MKRLVSFLLTLALPAPAVAASINSQSSIPDLGNVVEVIFKVLIYFIPTVAVIYIAIAGYRYIIAQGNPDLMEKAKKSITYALYGLILAIASVAIIYTVGNKVFHFSTGL